MKLKIPPPFVALACLLILIYGAGKLPDFAFDFPYRLVLALVVCIAAGFINLSAVTQFIRNKTTLSPVAPDKAEKLVTTGMFQYSRNPMYLGLALLILAIGLLLGNMIVVPIVLIFVWYINRFQILPEELILEEKFGADYTEYKDKVRRWI